MGGSSTDAGKINPINYENVAGKFAVVESGFRIVSAQTETDMERDLRNSVQARYEPQLMMTRVHEMFCRLSKSLDQFSVKEENVRRNLLPVRERPTEAMTVVTRAHGYLHPNYGVGHDVVKEFAKQARSSGRKLLEVALTDAHFKAAYDKWPEWHQRILQGELELYIGPAKQKAKSNIEYARNFK